MRELYSLEIIRLVEELKTFENFYLDQFYETDTSKFRIKLSRKGEKANLQCLLPYAINRTSTIETKEQASNFSMAVRKRALGLKITKIEQYNNDRIILFRAEKPEYPINLIFEMFGRGNLIITDGNMKILLAYKIHEFKDRSVKPNSDYLQPKNSSANPTDKNALEKVMGGISGSQKETTLLQYLTKNLAIGSLYIEESLNRLQLSASTKLKETDAKTVSNLGNEISSLVEECTRRPEFTAYLKDNRIVDFALCKIKKYSTLEQKQFGSLESCLEFVYGHASMGKEEKNEDEEKIRASLQKQVQFLNEIDAEIAQNKQSGQQIMNNMHAINAIIGAARSKKNPAIEDLKSLSDRIEILSISTKNKSIKIRIRDESNA